MNKKYERYIEYIVSDIEAPYFENMVEMYGLRPDEYELVLSKIYDQPVRIKGDRVYDTNGNYIYYEDSNGSWIKREYDANGNLIYREKDNGFWVKKEYNADNKMTYREYNDGYWERLEYDDYGNQNYYENEEGDIEDNR